MKIKNNPENSDFVIRNILQEIEKARGVMTEEDVLKEVIKKGKTRLNKFIRISSTNIKDYIISSYDFVGIFFTEELIKSLVGNGQMKERIKKINEIEFSENIDIKIKIAKEFIKNELLPIIKYYNGQKNKKVFKSTIKKVDDIISSDNLNPSLP